MDQRMMQCWGWSKRRRGGRLVIDGGGWTNHRGPLERGESRGGL
jgi:hypothetical protein